MPPRGAKGGSVKVQGGGAGPGIAVGVTISGADKASDEFKQARREVNGRLRLALQRAGEREALPQIRSAFPSLKGARGRGLPRGAMANSLFVKRDRTTVYVGSKLRGSLNRALGWIDFGGKRARDKAVRRGPHVIVSTLTRRRPQIDQRILVELMQVFDGLEHKP